MLNLDNKLFKKVETIVFLANSPGFIYDTMVEDGIARSIYEAHSGKSLLSTINELAHIEPNEVTVEQAILLLACGVALRFGTREEINALKTIDVKWSPSWETIKRKTIESVVRFEYTNLSVGAISIVPNEIKPSNNVITRHDPIHVG